MNKDLAALSAQLRNLEDLEFIRSLIGRYAIGADRKNDPSIIGPLFAEDGVWECEGFGRFEGRERIASALSEAAQKQIIWTLHYMVSPTIELDGDSARGSWYLWETATVASASKELRSIWCGGNYDATFTRRDGRWYFHHVCLNIRLSTPFEKPWGLNPRTWP